MAGQVPDLVLRSALYARAMQAIDDVDLFNVYMMNLTVPDAAARTSPAFSNAHNLRVDNSRSTPVCHAKHRGSCWTRRTSWTHM